MAEEGERGKILGVEQTLFGVHHLRMAELESVNHTDDRKERAFIVTPEMMDFLKELGMEHNMSPMKVLSRLIWIGKKHVESEKSGAVIKVEHQGKEKIWKAFNDEHTESLEK